MKRILHILFAFSVSIASCQCATAEPVDQSLMPVSQDCHDERPEQVHAAQGDCCESEAVTKKSAGESASDGKALQSDTKLEATVAGLLTIGVGIDGDHSLPPPDTPVSRWDRLLD